MHNHDNGYDHEWPANPMQIESTMPATVPVSDGEPAHLLKELRAAILAQAGVSGDTQSDATSDAHVLAYARVSKSVQVSIPDQKRAIEDDVATHGLNVERHRWDVGSRWDDERPDYRALVDDIKSGEFTHLWLFNADRLGGDDQEFVATVRLALKHKMVVRDTVHGVIDDVMASILGLVSYLEIKHNHYRVANAFMGKHLEGVKLGKIPTGYEPQCRIHPCRCGRHGKHLPVEPRATQVRMLFERYAAGESLAVLQRWWNAETGEHRELGRIRSILTDPYYVGVIVNRRTYNGRVEGRGRRKPVEWRVGMHEHPLVGPQTFATCQERLRSQENVGQHRRERPDHPLVGLVHCVGCGRRMRRNYGHRNSAQWECPVCGQGRSIPKVDNATIELLAEIPFPEDAAVEDYAREQARMQVALQHELAAIAAERDRHNRRRSAWADALGDGTMSKADYRSKIVESDKQLGELRRQEAALRDSHIAQPGRAALLGEVRQALRRMGNWTTTLAAMSLDEQRELYRALIKAVSLDLHAGRMTLEYTDALARWYGRKSDTVDLPSQKTAARRESPTERSRRYRARKRELAAS